MVIHFIYRLPINWDSELLLRHWMTLGKKRKRNHQWAEPLIESHASHSEIALSMITQGSIHRGLLVPQMR